MTKQTTDGEPSPSAPCSRSSDTPETDELDRELHAKGVLADRYSDMLDLARKLERERDEGIRLVRRLLRYADKVGPKHPTRAGQNARADAGLWLARIDPANH